MEHVMIALMLCLFAGFSVLLIIVFLHLKNYKNLSRYLENHHPLKWQDLGEPGLTNTSPRNVMRLLKFLTSTSEYQDDVNLKTLIDKTGRTLKTGIVIFSVNVLLFLVLFVLVRASVRS